MQQKPSRGDTLQSSSIFQKLQNQFGGTRTAQVSISANNTPASPEIAPKVDDDDDGIDLGLDQIELPFGGFESDFFSNFRNIDVEQESPF